MYATVTELLATGMIPQDHCLEDSTIEENITNASREVDSKVGGDYPVRAGGWKFEIPPDTPHSISRVCLWLAASDILLALGIIERAESGPPMWVTYRNLALKDLELIRMKKMEVYDDAGTELDTDMPTPTTTVQAGEIRTVDGIPLVGYGGYYGGY